MRAIVIMIGVFALTVASAGTALAQDEPTAEPTRTNAETESDGLSPEARRRAQRLGLDTDEVEMLTTVADVVTAATNAGIRDVAEVLGLVDGCDVDADTVRETLDADSDGRVDDDVNLEVLIRSQCTH